MKSVQKLDYKEGLYILWEDIGSGGELTPHIKSLIETATCPYCETHLDEAYCRFTHECISRRHNCTICGWWRIVDRVASDGFGLNMKGDLAYFEVGVLFNNSLPNEVKSKLDKALTKFFTDPSNQAVINNRDHEIVIKTCFQSIESVKLLCSIESINKKTHLFLLDSIEGKLAFRTRQNDDFTLNSVGLVRQLRGALLYTGTNDGDIELASDDLLCQKKDCPAIVPSGHILEKQFFVNSRILLEAMGSVVTF